jgi:hypothetical protein
VSGWRSDFYNAVASNSSYGPYFNLGANLAIAEGQASIAGWYPNSWQFSCWALDSALYYANALKTRMQIDVNALSSLRNNVCSVNPPANAKDSIKTLRTQYATAVYTTAESWCGNGTCDPNESCSSCASDCGSCIYCGNGKCDGNETCQSCSQDCGSCPCPNNPGGQPNTYYFCIQCHDGWGNWQLPYTRTQAACTQSIAFSWVQGSTSSNCLIYGNACP